MRNGQQNQIEKQHLHAPPRSMGAEEERCTEALKKIYAMIKKGNDLKHAFSWRHNTYAFPNQTAARRRIRRWKGYITKEQVMRSTSYNTTHITRHTTARALEHNIVSNHILPVLTILSHELSFISTWRPPPPAGASLASAPPPPPIVSSSQPTCTRTA